MVCFPLQVQCHPFSSWWTCSEGQVRRAGEQVRTEAAPLPQQPANRDPQGRKPLPQRGQGPVLRPAGATAGLFTGRGPTPSALQLGPAACVFELVLPGPETQAGGLSGLRLPPSMGHSPTPDGTMCLGAQVTSVLWRPSRPPALFSPTLLSTVLGGPGPHSFHDEEVPRPRGQAAIPREGREVHSLLEAPQLWLGQRRH